MNHACPDCEREFGVHDPNASHTPCKRHMIAMYRQIEMATGTDLSGQIAMVQGRLDSTFPQDLAQLRAKETV